MRGERERGKERERKGGKGKKAKVGTHRSNWMGLHRRLVTSTSDARKLSLLPQSFPFHVLPLLILLCMIVMPIGLRYSERNSFIRGSNNTDVKSNQIKMFGSFILDLLGTSSFSGE